jgi:hypothetical protein
VGTDQEKGVIFRWFSYGSSRIINQNIRFYPQEDSKYPPVRAIPLQRVEAYSATIPTFPQYFIEIKVYISHLTYYFIYNILIDN